MKQKGKTPFGILWNKDPCIYNFIVGRGFHITLELAKRKARVIMACADENKGKLVRQKIVQRTGNTDVVVQHLDVTMMSSVRSFVTWFKIHEKKLDILINNKEILCKLQTRYCKIKKLIWMKLKSMNGK